MNVTLKGASFFALVSVLLLAVSFLRWQGFGVEILGSRFSLERSSVRVWVLDNKLNLNFKVLEKDRLEFAKFLTRLGHSSNLETLYLGLDKNSLDKLSKVTPIELDLVITGNELSFRSKPYQYLSLPFSSNDYRYATGSSTIVLKVSSDKDYDLEVVNPAGLVKEATLSGSFFVSREIDGLMTNLSNIAKIEVKVREKNAQGKIELVR